MAPAKNTPGKPEEVNPTPATAPGPRHRDETDVPAALARKTQDGKGPDPVPGSDFDSFATEGVENKSGLLSVEDVTDQVLAGRWGATENTAKNRLEAVGYDVDEVFTEFKRRKDGGAPSAF